MDMGQTAAIPTQKFGGTMGSRFEVGVSYIEVEPQIGDLGKQTIQ